MIIAKVSLTSVILGHLNSVQKLKIPQDFSTVKDIFNGKLYSFGFPETEFEYHTLHIQDRQSISYTNSNVGPGSFLTINAIKVASQSQIEAPWGYRESYNVEINR